MHSECHSFSSIQLQLISKLNNVTQCIEYSRADIGAVDKTLSIVIRECNRQC